MEQVTKEECSASVDAMDCPACFKDYIAWAEKQFTKLTSERDLYAAQAKINAQTVVRQAHEIRRLERLIDVEKRALAAEHETQERFR